MFKPLDPLLHSELRLAIVSLLSATEKAEFNFIKTQTGASSGNLSVQLSKLSEAGYLTIHKSFKNNYPHTECELTVAGRKAFENYILALQSYLKPSKKA